MKGNPRYRKMRKSGQELSILTNGMFQYDASDMAEFDNNNYLSHLDGWISEEEIIIEINTAFNQDIMLQITPKMVEDRVYFSEGTEYSLSDLAEYLDPATHKIVAYHHINRPIFVPINNSATGYIHIRRKCHKRLRSGHNYGLDYKFQTLGTTDPTSGLLDIYGACAFELACKRYHR